MPEGVNGNSERIGGIHFEVSAVGADKATQEVNKTAGAVRGAGASAEAASPKFAKLQSAFRAVGLQAIGLVGGIGQLGGALVSLLPGWGAVAAAAASAAVGLRNYIEESTKIKADQINDELRKTAEGFNKLVASFANPNQTDFERTFNYLIDFAKMRTEQLNAQLDKEYKDRGILDRIFDYSVGGVDEMKAKALTEGQQLQIELNKAIDQLLDESRKRRAKAEEDATKKIIATQAELRKKQDREDALHMGDDAVQAFREKQEQDKTRLALLKQQTDEIQKQAALINGMIDAQTRFAQQFNNKLNIEQLQAINATITRIENAIQRWR